MPKELDVCKKRRRFKPATVNGRDFKLVMETPIIHIHIYIYIYFYIYIF
tara:strand:- start:2048 stop:2194 length:147 start_codon:yes stop_codon:yes gene_type:complete